MSSLMMVLRYSTRTKMTTEVTVLTIYVLLRLCWSMMEMLMMGTPKMVRQVVSSWHWRVIMK